MKQVINKLDISPTELDLKIQSTMFKDTSFYSTETYDVKVKKDLGRRKMTGNSRFIQRLFPSSKVLCANPGVSRDYYTWNQLIEAIENQNPPLYDTRTQQWDGFPDLTQWTQHSERDMAVFLNYIVDQCVTVLGGMQVIGRAPRRWTAEYSTIHLFGHDAKRKPDLILLDNVAIADWRCVRSIGEMKSSSSEQTNANMFEQIAGKTSIIYASQDNREYVLSVGFLRERMFLYKIDRGGSVSSLSVQIQGHENQWKLFLRTIISLAIGPAEVIGYDASIDTVPVPKGIARCMKLQYYPLHTDLRSRRNIPNLRILSTIFIGDGIVGRGTCVFRVQDTLEKGLFFIVKDTWHDPKRPFTEGQILQLIHGIPGVPQYVQEVVVSSYQRSRTFVSRMITVDEQQGGMDRLEEELGNDTFEDRIHLRLQTKASNAKLITEFNNRKELAMALLCCVKAHRQAFEERGVLHRDIHLGNIFIDDGEDASMDAKGKGKGKDEGSKGMLGDWGIAQCTRIPIPYNIKPPMELPELPVTRQHDEPEYSDSEDENWMNPPLRQPPSPPALQTASRVSERLRNKAPAKPTRSPTPMDSQLSDATTIDNSKIELDDLYKIFNPWFDEDAPEKLLNRTGAPSFLAIELMLKFNSPDRQHLPEHDLESFFYVIVIITMLYEGPRTKKGPSYWKAKNLELAYWWNVQDWKTSALWRWSTMSNTELHWRLHVTTHISDYFKCWKGCLNDLRSAVFGHMKIVCHEEKSTIEYANSKPITYDAMIAILEKMVALGAAEDELSDGDAQHYNQEEWKDYHGFQTLDGERVSGVMEWVFPKVETFRIMDAIERTVAPAEVAGDGHFASSDIPADEYSADPYRGGQPDVGDIVKHYDSSIRTSVLPTSSGAITSFPSSADMPPTSMPPTSMPPTSMPPTSMAPTSSSSKRMGPGSPLPPPNDDSDNGPQRKKPRQTQPSKQPSRKGKATSSSAPASLKTPTGTSHRANDSSRKSKAATSRVSRATNSRGSRGTTSRGGQASTSRRSRRSGRDEDPEYVPPEAKTPTTQRQDAARATKSVKKAVNRRPGLGSV